MPRIFASTLSCIILLLSAFSSFASAQEGLDSPGSVTHMKKEIYLAGGCFWGVQEYFSRIPGVLATEAGYAQSNCPAPSYEEVCGGTTNAAETVRIVYDPDEVSLELLLKHFFAIIDPLAVNRQGNDRGTQYRTGIYYTDMPDGRKAAEILARQAGKYSAPLATQVEKLVNFYPAEAWHQDYLRKNPGGYCHIDFSPLQDPALRRVKTMDAAEKSKRLVQLPELSRHVTQEEGTEPPFSGKYWDFNEPGLYVDIVSGQPLFSSRDKFPSQCGWPAFARPVSSQAITSRTDNSHGMHRVEVRSKSADSHLGHVFEDGPRSLGGLRYCINSAALRFIPLKDMVKEGYGEWIGHVEESR